MHDLGHFSVFSTSRMNRWVQYLVMCVYLGGSARYWRNAHWKHHLFTNIEGWDHYVDTYANTHALSFSFSLSICLSLSLSLTLSCLACFLPLLTPLRLFFQFAFLRLDAAHA